MSSTKSIVCRASNRRDEEKFVVRTKFPAEFCFSRFVFSSRWNSRSGRSRRSNKSNANERNSSNKFSVRSTSNRSSSNRFRSVKCFSWNSFSPSFLSVCRPEVDRRFVNLSVRSVLSKTSIGQWTILLNCSSSSVFLLLSLMLVRQLVHSLLIEQVCSSSLMSTSVLSVEWLLVELDGLNLIEFNRVRWKKVFLVSPLWSLAELFRCFFFFERSNEKLFFDTSIHRSLNSIDEIVFVSLACLLAETVVLGVSVELSSRSSRQSRDTVELRSIDQGEKVLVEMRRSDGLSVTFFENELVVVLGRNGSG